MDEAEHHPFQAGANKGIIKGIKVRFATTRYKSGRNVMMTDKH